MVISYLQPRTFLLALSVILTIAAFGLLVHGSRSVLAQGNGAPAVQSGTNSPATGLPEICCRSFPEIGNNPWVNTSYIADGDGLSGATFSYQWMTVVDGVDTDIPDAILDFYIVRSVDLGKYLKVRVSFTDDAGNSESLTSAAVGPVRNKRNPPSNVQVTSGDGNLGVTWDAPVNVDAVPISHYKVPGGTTADTISGSVRQS